jgi:predicted nucleotidyltransferase
MPAEANALPVAEERIGEIAKRIGREFHPLRIILFGSYARGEQTADSDLDLLVVFPGPVDKAVEAVKIRRAIGRINTGVDVVVSSAQEVAEWEHVTGTLYYYARKEGRLVYGQ